MPAEVPQQQQAALCTLSHLDAVRLLLVEHEDEDAVGARAVHLCEQRQERAVACLWLHDLDDLRDRRRGREGRVAAAGAGAAGGGVSLTFRLPPLSNTSTGGSLPAPPSRDAHGHLDGLAQELLRDAADGGGPRGGEHERLAATRSGVARGRQRCDDGADVLLEAEVLRWGGGEGSQRRRGEGSAGIRACIPLPPPVIPPSLVPSPASRACGPPRRARGR